MSSDDKSLAPIALTPESRRELEAALKRLQSGRGLIVRLADLLGGAVNRMGRYGLRRLGMSTGLANKFSGVAEAALARAYDVAILGLSGPASGSPQITRAGVMVSGATSGFIGMGGFLPDATFTTLAIMREIARIARNEGEDLSSEDARRACLEVFAFKSAAEEDDESELGYFSARLIFQGAR